MNRSAKEALKKQKEEEKRLEEVKKTLWYKIKNEITFILVVLMVGPIVIMGRISKKYYDYFELGIFLYWGFICVIVLIINRDTGFHTTCSDGWVSNSIGIGTCSYHGGIK